jgi:hypothetical protein
MNSQAQETMLACGFESDKHVGLGAEGGALWLKAKEVSAKWCCFNRQIEFGDGSLIRFVSNPGSMFSTTYEAGMAQN